MTTRLMTAIGALAAAASMTLHAQAPQTTTTPQPPDHPRPTITQSNTRALPASPAMTLTGCLQQAPNTKSDPDDRAAAIPAYVLSNVKMSASSSVSGIGVSTKYEITGLPEAELKKHLNHQVELIGQLVKPEDGKPDDNTPDFIATTLKMLSASCNAAQ